MASDMSARSIVLLALVLAGAREAGATGPPTAEPVVASRGTLSDILRAAAEGSPLLFVLDADHAVIATSADGKLKRVMAPAPVREALYDGARELLWLRRDGALEVVDLRQPRPRPIPIVAGLSNEGQLVIQIEGERDQKAQSACAATGATALKWHDPPTVEVTGFDGRPPAPPRLPGEAWLRSELGRPRRGFTVQRTELPSSDPRSSIRLPKKVTVGKCDPENACGTIADFGQTGWQLVFAGEERAGECRRYRCLLRDPVSGRFGRPPHPAKWTAPPTSALVGDCGVYRFDASGKWYALPGKLCSAAGPCADLGTGVPIGWLDGELVVGAQ